MTNAAETLDQQEAIAQTTKLLKQHYAIDVTSLEILRALEDLTFLVHTSSLRYIAKLRMASSNLLTNETTLVNALEADITPPVIPAQTGDLFVPYNENVFLTLTTFQEGRSPSVSKLTPDHAAALGGAVAHLHKKISTLSYDLDQLPIYNGEYFRAALSTLKSRTDILTEEDYAALDQSLTLFNRWYNALGQTASLYNVIHSDLNLSNFICHNDQTVIIDFSSAGHGHFVIDLASTIVEFMDDPARAQALTAAFLDGYTTVQPLPIGTLTQEEALAYGELAQRLFYIEWMLKPENKAVFKEKAAKWLAPNIDFLKTIVTQYTT